MKTNAKAKMQNAERCEGKKIYRYEEHARRAVKEQRVFHNNRLFHYHCKRCKRWHLATAGKE